MNYCCLHKVSNNFLLNKLFIFYLNFIGLYGITYCRYSAPLKFTPVRLLKITPILQPSSPCRTECPFCLISSFIEICFMP